MDAAAKCDFAGNRASLSLNATDIFNSRKRHFYQAAMKCHSFWTTRRKLPGNAIFSYRFGKGSGASKPAKQEKRIEDAS